MKKIFILTGEASGDKLASKVISNLKKLNTNIEYLSVGGENLKKIGIANNGAANIIIFKSVSFDGKNEYPKRKENAANNDNITIIASNNKISISLLGLERFIIDWYIDFIIIDKYFL